MDNNYTIIHLHTMLSNGTTNIDSITKFEDYIDKAKELGMKAIAFTEHGNLFSWKKKKEYCEKNGLKYIHGVECYITSTLSEKIRDNYHTCLYASNFEGFKEINKLISKANNRKSCTVVGDEEHFYYVPRISMEDFLNISDNVIVSSACLGSVLGKCKDEKVRKQYLDYFIKHKNRCFLELQHHLVKDQMVYNKSLYELHKKYDVPLIIGTDTHALNDIHLKGRSILQKSKKIYFENEEGWDLSLKSYDELIEIYKKHKYISSEEIEKALENTNKLADMVEEFTIDKSYKYPKLYNDSEKVLKEKIRNGIINRGINKKNNFKEYKDRINYELKTIKANGSTDFFLLEEDVKSMCRNKGIGYGYSRGSVSGSEIAYALYITDVDSIKHKMNFERFMNLERVSLADVDTDYPANDRKTVKDYLFNKKGLYCSEIITFNTIALKGAIRDVGRALDIPLSEISDMCENIEQNEQFYRDDEKYNELFEYVDILQGVIVSVGSHPCGFIVSPIPLDDNIGLFTTSTSEYPVSQINMKEVDALNFVKLDILGLDNIQIINDVCKLVNIERLTPDNIDENDEKVWKSILESNLGIFQWESKFAHDYYKKLFSKETIEKIKSKNPNFNYMDLFSIGNGAIRPAGESYREALANGEYKNNGHKALDDFLAPTLGYLVYQEQIIEFLHSFCGFTMGEADIVRRGFAKKTGTEKYLPKIKDGFYKTMIEKYNTPQEESEKIIVSFIKVIEDASSYLFSENHAKPYSYIGYACAWLRYYYPLEFLTVVLNINKDNDEKTSKAIEYMKNKDINISLPIFGLSKGEYFFSKQTNTIYKGIGSLKGLGIKDGDELYQLSQENKYSNFIDLIKDIKEKTSVNDGKLKVLIKLDYFSEFGKSQRLLDLLDIYNNFTGKKQIKIDQLQELNLTQELMDKYSNKKTAKIYKELNIEGLIKELINRVEDKEIKLKEKLQAELELLGYITTKLPLISENLVYIMKIDEFKNKKSYTYYTTIYDIKTGEEIRYRISDYKIYMDYPFKEGDIIKICEQHKSNKKKQIDGKWVVLKDEFNNMLDWYEIY
ncbi:DNA polymerase III subunit alpha [Clostridium sp.]|uniref:DNA polymerase III subunit alpha n=1 Tax=Clostridium sp. TaxID=1506 RepID=UPI002604C904|nr:DNA polymerase III subunit alpha [Clostridium sp.]